MRVRTLPTGTHESNNKKTNTYLLETDTVTKWSSRLEHGVTTHAALAAKKKKKKKTGQARTCGARPHTQRENINRFRSHGNGKDEHFSRRATSADSGSECRRPGFLRLSPLQSDVSVVA